MGIFRFAQGQLTRQPLVQSAPNSNSVQTLWLSSLPDRMKKIRSKLKALEWPQYNKLIFFGAQGQLTRQPLVQSAPNSNSVQTLWLSSLPDRMKKIRSKMKALEWPQDNKLIFFWRPRADNSEVSSGICQKFELIQVFMHVLVTCKNEEDPMKNILAGVATTFFSHYKSMGIFRFAQGQLTPQPLVRSAHNSNSVQTLWLTLLPERMKKI